MLDNVSHELFSLSPKNPESGPGDQIQMQIATKLPPTTSAAVCGLWWLRSVWPIDAIATEHNTNGGDDYIVKVLGEENKCVE